MASIKRRTSPIKFAHFAEKSGKGSISNLSTKVTTGSPVEKVVELIKELKGKIETDAANEQKIYDKFACWSAVTKPTTVQHVYSTFEMRRYGMQIDG